VANHPTTKTWRPPARISRKNILDTSRTVLNRRSGKVRRREDVFRIRELGFDWDMGVYVYDPYPVSSISRGADGKRIGMLLLHGGAGDFKTMDGIASLFAEKFACRVASMTFPGRLFFDDKSRDWPDDTIQGGIIRTPIWKRGEYVSQADFIVKQDRSKLIKYGTRTVIHAKKGTKFYHRMASWPAAFEAGMKEACRRHFPETDFSIYVHGHSTGGPYVSMLSQRVANIAGVMAVENSSFGYINEQKHLWSGSIGKIEGFQRIADKGEAWNNPFYELYIRTWRDLARYKGSEALGQEGPDALMRLPWLMEEILDRWDSAKKRPNFKAEYVITHNIVGSLEAAARVSARRLKLNRTDTKALITRFAGYTRPLEGDGVKPVPPFLFAISKDSRDHSPEVYREVILPLFKAMKPRPKFALTRFGAGVHSYWTPEKDLPLGIAPAVAQFYHDAIKGGFYMVH
jgi:hypothetical protein